MFCKKVKSSLAIKFKKSFLCLFVFSFAVSTHSMASGQAVEESSMQAAAGGATQAKGSPSELLPKIVLLPIKIASIPEQKNEVVVENSSSQKALLQSHEIKKLFKIQDKKTSASKKDVKPSQVNKILFWSAIVGIPVSVILAVFGIYSFPKSVSTVVPPLLPVLTPSVPTAPDSAPPATNPPPQSSLALPPVLPVAKPEASPPTERFNHPQRQILTRNLSLVLPPSPTSPAATPQPSPLPPPPTSRATTPSAPPPTNPPPPAGPVNPPQRQILTRSLSLVLPPLPTSPAATPQPSPPQPPTNPTPPPATPVNPPPPSAEPLDPPPPAKPVAANGNKDSRIRRVLDRVKVLFSKNKGPAPSSDPAMRRDAPPTGTPTSVESNQSTPKAAGPPGGTEPRPMQPRSVATIEPPAAAPRSPTNQSVPLSVSRLNVNF